MEKKLFTFILAFVSLSIYAQTNDAVVMKVNGKEVKMSEFEYIYNKNNNDDAIDKKTLEEYVTLFKNFKLKVAEAETQGIDTTVAFHKELNDYRTQLARPYLAINEENEPLLKAAYNRDIYSEVSGILIPFPQFERKENNFTLTPADTLATYQKAIEIRKLAIKKNADFEKLVSEHSADDRSRNEERPGYLGWMSNLGLLPSFEQALMDTKEGDVTQPIRVQVGYYLLKVHRKMDNPGEVHAAHILIALPEDADAVQISDAETKLKEIDAKLKEKIDFAELAEEYSADPGSAQRGGDLSWFQFGRMVPEFNEKVFSMNINEISEPVKTRFGYHIIKLLGQRERPDFETTKPQIKSKLEQTGHYYSLYEPAFERLKNENEYIKNTSVYNELLTLANTLSPTDSVYIEQIASNNQTLFTIAGKAFTASNFAEHLKNNARTFSNVTTEIFQDRYNQFLSEKSIEAEDKALESKYIDFKNLMQEYRDGILLFEVSNREVWDKAASDTIGLAQYFETNKSKYAWNEPHWKGSVVLVKNAKDKKKMQKQVAKMNPEEAVQYLSDNYKVGDVSTIKIEKGGLFTKSKNAYVDEVIFKTGKAELPEEYQDFFLVGKLLSDGPESYTDVRGLVITDYQNQLEIDWIEYLNEKYSVQIYQDVINKLK